jgi:penicillin-binding protein 1A
VFDGWPTNDPQAGIIWEAFKPDTEPRRGGRQDEIDAMRDLVPAQLRRREQGANASAVDQAIEEPSDFVEDQGGIY